MQELFGTHMDMMEKIAEERMNRVMDREAAKLEIAEMKGQLAGLQALLTARKL